MRHQLNLRCRIASGSASRTSWHFRGKPARHPSDGRMGRHGRRQSQRAYGSPMAAVRKSGAKLIWGGEAAAVRHDGRANPNQLVVGPHIERGLAHLREVLTEEHRHLVGSDDGLLIGLQLTHSGRYSRPDADNRPRRRILYRHPILDRRVRLAAGFPLLTDGEIGAIVEDFHRAGQMASRARLRFCGRQTLPRLSRARISERAHTRRTLRRQLREPHALSARNRRGHSRARPRT